MIGLYDRDLFEVLSIFSISSGSRFNRQFLKEKTKMPNTILDNTLNHLVNLKLLKKNKNLYEINFENEDVNEIIKELAKNYVKFKRLPLREYFLIIYLSEELANVKNIGEVYLFGSYAKLIFTDNSDIDIAIISNKVDKKKIAGIVRKIEKKVGRRIEIHYFTNDFYKNKRDALVKEILNHGVRMI